MTEWNCYVSSPIDYGWDCMPDLTEVATKLVLEETQNEIENWPAGLGRDLLGDFRLAKEAARKKGWEGDFTEGPKVIFLPLPDETNFSYMFVWKQKNNGSLFFVSPIELPWMDFSEI